MKKYLRLALIVILLIALAAAAEHFMPGLLGGLADGLPSGQDGTQTLQTLRPDAQSGSGAEVGEISEDGEYDSKDELALYIHLYGHLPANFVTKAEAEAAGWNGGELEKVMPGKCIGGDSFGNREGLLPKAKGRTWTECDVNTLGARSRGPERIVFSNDGLIYYTPDHYESFELLYGEP